MNNKPTSRPYGSLVVSFIPLTVKAISYSLIGGYTPFAVLVLFGAWVVWSIRRGKTTARRAVRVWAASIILWGIARLGLMGLFLLTSVSEAHVESQFSVWYVALSLFHIAIGVYLFQQNRKVVHAV